MSSLTDTSILSRKVIRYGIYAAIIIFIGRFALEAAVNFYRKKFPPPPPKPTLIFGNMPQLPFPDKTTAKNLSYTLELVDGKLPTLPVQAKVFEMPAPLSDINVVENAKKEAGNLGFDPNGRLLVETIPNVYVFKSRNTPSSLVINVISGTFSINYDIQSDISVVSGIPLTEEASTNRVVNILKTANTLPADIRDGPKKQEFLKLERGSLVSAQALNDANAIKINFFRQGYGEQDLPAVTPDMPEANVWFILGDKGAIVAAEFHYYPVNPDKSGTYPLITSDQAWEKLQKGEAYIANPGNNPGGNIIIRKVYPSYYDAGRFIEFYQPVVVFEGDNNFYAFVPAVQDDFYGKEESENKSSESSVD